MRLVLPLALLFVLLPPLAKSAERVHLGVASLAKQLAIGTRVEKPVPVLFRHVRHEPGDLFAVENDLVADTRLDEPVGVDQVTVELEA